MTQALAALRTLSLGQPIVLLVLVVAVPFLALVARARLRMTPGPMRSAVLVTRSVIAALLVLALAQPAARASGQARDVVFAIDLSDSISADQVAWARDWVDRAVAALPTGSHSTVLEFASRAQLAGAAGTLPTSSTDLNDALRLGASILGRDQALAPELVLLSDGWQTSGQPVGEAVPSGIAVSYVPLPIAGNSQVAAIHAINVPSTARAGDRIDVELDLQATTTVDAQLRLSINQTVVANGPIHLQPGDTQLTLPAPVPEPGFVEVQADLRVGDRVSTLSSSLVAKSAGHILVLEDEPARADALVSLLASEGLQVDRRPASSVPPSATELGDFDGAVLVDVPATSLTLDQQRTLQSFVQDLGRGLVVVGGPRTFSPGGYQGTPLDDLMPVAADPPLEPQQGSLALFLVIDRSGSMDLLGAGGAGQAPATKIAMAREAAIEAAGLLQPEDTLGVIAFDSAFDWVVPPTRLQTPNDIKQVQSRIATIKAGGGTSILPPLRAAFEAAANSDAPLKHIVLMTDGESNDQGYENLLARMAPDQITLSTLAIGSDADTRLLTSLAHLGGGRYYFTERSTEIPRIAGKETTILTRNAIVQGQAAAVVAEPSPILRSLSGDLPTLSGYVATTRKDRAVTALETQHGQPLLAHWQYGLGRVVAWTSEVQQGWASNWATWPDAAQFWSQAVRWSLPAPISASFEPSAELGPDGRQVTLSLQSIGDDGTFADLQDTRATVLAPDGSAREVALPQTGPGRYTADLRVTAPGQYRVLFKQGQREETAAFSAPDAVELHSVGANTVLLDQLATSSGGHALTDPTDLAPGSGPGPTLELSPWLLALALALLPLDVFLRRRV